IAFVIFARKRKYSLRESLMLADYLAITMPLAQPFGRSGCMAAGCCWGQPAFHLDEAGKVIPDIPFAAHFPAAHGDQPASLAYNALVRNAPSGLPDGVDPQMWVKMLQDAHETMPLFPSQLAEALGVSIMFLVLLLIRSKKWFHGQMLLSYAALYAALRFTLEFFRGDAGRGVGVVSTSQGIAIGVVVVCIGAVFFLRNTDLSAASDKK
ncbi:MAG: prolipoprotein diacylglyceryl transferase, partial [Deltaproteobacteria bacterium]|nr:prolipoprotein diacylglyceryl transferase [Deltaproteobacteria bacterium]